MMQGRVRQHHTKVRVSGSNAPGKFGPRVIPAFQQNDRSFRRAEQSFLKRANFTFGFDGFDRRKHQGKRLFFAVLQAAQALDGAVVAPSHNEMETPEPFDGHNSSVANSLDCQREGFAAQRQYFTSRIPKFEMRSAFRARIWLSMKPAIVWIVVFSLTLPTHSELLHRRVTTIIRQRLDD